MTDQDPTLQDLWRLLGTMNRRFDALERQNVRFEEKLAALKAELGAELTGLTGQIGSLRADMQQGFGALRASIEARDFRLDEHGRRIAAGRKRALVTRNLQRW
jgi:hypothetical protein